MRGLRIKSEHPGFLALGASSMLLVFVVLCLVCFAALSPVGANAEARLTVRLGEGEETAYTLLKSASVVTEELTYTELPFIWNGVITDD